MALPFAEPISEALLDRSDPGLVRIAIGGLWVLTLFEYLLTLFRLEERARAYFVTTIANVAGDDPGDGRAGGRRRGGRARAAARQLRDRRRLRPRADRASSAAASRCVVERGRCCARLLRFGLPTMPAELSLYSLNFIDRIIIVRYAGLAEAGLYSLAVKFAQAVNVLVRGFQLAWPPLAYSIRDDDEARRAYAVIVTWFVAGCAFVVTGMWLLARWIVRALAAPEFFDSYEAVGLVSDRRHPLRALHGPGRDPRPHRANRVQLPGHDRGARPPTSPSTCCSSRRCGIVGAGLALVASYLVVLALMYGFTQRLFPVPYEWGRLARIVAAPRRRWSAIGELVLPTEGALGALLGARLCGSPTRRCCCAAASSLPRERGWLALLAPPAASWPPACARSASAGEGAARLGARGLRGGAARRGLATALTGECLAAASRRPSPRPGSSAWRAWAR